MHDRDVRTEETHVGDIANKARAFHVRPQQRIVKVNELVAPAEARAVERDEIRIIGERRRERFSAAAIPSVHHRGIQLPQLPRVEMRGVIVAAVNLHGAPSTSECVSTLQASLSAACALLSNLAAGSRPICSRQTINRTVRWAVV